MGKKVVQVEGEEKEVRNWKEFYELVEKEKGKRITLQDDDDPKLFMEYVGKRIMIDAKSNWYWLHAIAHNEMPITIHARDLMDILETNILRWRHIHISERCGIHMIELSYNIEDHDIKPEYSIRYIIMGLPKDLDEIILPLRKIISRLNNYLKYW